MTNKEITRIGHIPKADDLHSVRDMLHILYEHNKRLDSEDLLKNINDLLHFYHMKKWAKSTFKDYLFLMTKLGLVTVERRQVSFCQESLSEIDELLITEKWQVQQPLSAREKQFFRSRLLQYYAVQRFLEIVFCDDRSFQGNIKELIANSKYVHGRENVLSAYMKKLEINQDRDARALLTWCIQTEIVQHDEYSGIYFLAYDENPSLSEFLEALAESYRKTYDKRLGAAVLPELRAVTCAMLHSPIRSFEDLFWAAKDMNPTAIYADRATVARDEVNKYGLRRHGFYYYYAKIYPKELR